MFSISDGAKGRIAAILQIFGEGVIPTPYEIRRIDL